jgi:excisionase family DNA binding protein
MDAIPPVSTQKALTVKDAALALELSRAMIYRLLAQGALVSFTVGRARRIPVWAIDEFIVTRCNETEL